MSKEGTFDFFDDRENKASDHWVGMPEYDNTEKEAPKVTVTFKFRSLKDFEEFKESVKKNLYDGEPLFYGEQGKGDNKQAWYPLFVRPNKFEYRDES